MVTCVNRDENDLLSQSESSEVQVLRTSGGILRDHLNALLMLSSERIEITSLEKISMLATNKLERSEVGKITPKLS